VDESVDHRGGGDFVAEDLPSGNCLGTRSREGMTAGAALFLLFERVHSFLPVFAQNKFNRGFRRFQRRGRAAVRSEWRLQAAVQNLLKLHSHWISPALT
jgi:hypothetical protein